MPTATAREATDKVRANIERFRKMLSEGLPPVLAQIGDDGLLRPGTTLQAGP